MTTETHEDYALTMRAWSERIVGAVHDDGPDVLLAHLAAAMRIPPPVGVDPVVALVTLLAAQVDPEASTEQRFGWLPGDVFATWHGKPAGYARHRRNREVPCQACTDAHTAEGNGTARRRRERAAA